MSEDTAEHTPEAKPTYHCSFCGKTNHEVALIAGPGPSLFICDECVGVCAMIVMAKATEKYEAQPPASQHAGENV